jgi:hypothetical protein
MKTKPTNRALEDTRNREVTGGLRMAGRTSSGAFVCFRPLKGGMPGSSLTSLAEKGGIMQNHEDEQAPSFPRVGEQPVAWGRGGRQEAAQYKALVDLETGKLFSIVSKNYRLIKHQDAIGQVEKAIARAAPLRNYWVTTKFHNDGGRMCRKYCFPDVRIELEPGDTINPELNLFNSYDMTWPFRVLLGAFRVVCSNGLVVRKRLFELRKRHVYELEDLNLGDEVSSALGRLSRQTMEWKKWAKQPLSEKAYGNILKAMNFGKKATQEIGEEIRDDIKDVDSNGFPITTVWIFFNILCWYITHKAVSINHRVDMETRLRAAVSNHLKEVA